MSNKLGQMNGNSDENAKARPPQRGGFLYLVAMILMLALFVFVAWQTRQKDDTSRPASAGGSASVAPETSQNGVELETKLRNMIQEETRRFHAKNESLIGNFEQNLQRAVDADFSAAESEIPETVNRLKGFGACNKLCYKLAKDRICGTNEAGEAIQTELAPVLKHCVTGTVKAEDLLQNLIQKLNENNSEYRANLAATAQSPEFAAFDSEILTRFSNNVLQKEVDVSEIAFNTVMAEIGTVLEIVFIRSTVKIVSSVFAKVVTRMVATVSASAISATADGPLPIGDIIGGGIAVVGTVWTGWDIYCARKVLPEKLTSSLEETVNGYRAEMLDSVKKRAEEARTACDAGGDTLEAQLVQIL